MINDPRKINQYIKSNKVTNKNIQIKPILIKNKERHNPMDNLHSNNDIRIPLL